ncbi:MAG TPA: hypothetical protein V6D21_15820, partial [Candidatus Obscuribacterales bacterium]
QMKPGSVIVDLAAEQGGNCECSEAGKDVVKHGVTIIGPINLPASMPIHASEVYAKNISALLALMINKDKQLEINFSDDILDGACVTHNGEIRSERVKQALTQNPQQSPVNS